MVNVQPVLSILDSGESFEEKARQLTAAMSIDIIKAFGFVESFLAVPHPSTLDGAIEGNREMFDAGKNSGRGFRNKYREEHRD